MSDTTTRFAPEAVHIDTETVVKVYLGAGMGCLTLMFVLGWPVTYFLPPVIGAPFAFLWAAARIAGARTARATVYRASCLVRHAMASCLVTVLLVFGMPTTELEDQWYYDYYCAPINQAVRNLWVLRNQWK